MKKSISKILELKKLSKKKLINLYAGKEGLKLNNGSTTTCGDEPENRFSIEYLMWESCIKSNSPSGGTDFCAFE